jgi:hypothetical protein
MGGGRSGEGEWEVRPGGMLVQQRRDAQDGPTVRLRVSHGPTLREVIVPAQATFGTLASSIRLSIRFACLAISSASPRLLACWEPEVS